MCGSSKLSVFGYRTGVLNSTRPSRKQTCSEDKSRSWALVLSCGSQHRLLEGPGLPAPAECSVVWTFSESAKEAA